MPRRRFNRPHHSSKRLTEEAERLRKEAQGTPSGIERERLIRRRDRQIPPRISIKWVSSPDCSRRALILVPQS
jgi:hypothetical protein